MSMPFGREDDPLRQLFTIADGAIPVRHLLTIREVCSALGGIHPSTLYRGIRKGLYPRPIHVGENSSRWVADEISATLAAMREGRVQA